MVAAAVAVTVNSKQLGGGGRQPRQNMSRPPLLPPDPDNAITPRRQKSREVTSRCLSMSSSSSNSSMVSTKKCTSPLVSRTSHSTDIKTPKHAASSAIKRSQSVERRQAVMPLPNNSMDLRTGKGELSAAQKLVVNSTRSLPVSFQGESFSYQFSKAKAAPSLNAGRKGTPERRKLTVAMTPGRGTNQTENSKGEWWPARFRQLNSMSRSMDCTEERNRLNRSVNGNVGRALQHPLTDNRDITAVNPVVSEAQCDPAASDIESVSSGSTSGAPESSCGSGDVRPWEIMVPVRFWQQTGNQLRRSDPSSPVRKKNTAHPKLIAPEKFGIDSPLLSPKAVLNSRGQFSPIRRPVLPASPSKLGASSTSSPLRGMNSSRVRNRFDDNLINRTSILSFAGDVIKIGDNKVSDAHLLRLLHNRLLQWRFVNARADAALSSQRSNAEKRLYNAWTTTTKLRESVRAKRTELHLLRQNLKLISILKGQMMFLDEWAVLDHDYCSSLSGATEALMASTLRLPIVCGARVDVPKLKNAICSAVDEMKAITSSMCSLSSKAAKVKSLLAELGNLSANEFDLLYQSKELLSAIAAMQVKECSLRTHILQLKRLPSALTTTL